MSCVFYIYATVRKISVFQKLSYSLENPTLEGDRSIEHHMNDNLSQSFGGFILQLSTDVETEMKRKNEELSHFFSHIIHMMKTEG